MFAYGQTASGKTFTLMGDENEPGIVPRALKDVFGYIRKVIIHCYYLVCCLAYGSHVESYARVSASRILSGDL